MPLFGSHLSVAGSFTRAVDEAVELGCTSLQVFTKAPNQWQGRQIGADEAREFRRAVKTSGLRKVMAHDSYLINLASQDESLFQRSVDAMTEEVLRADLLGLDYLVTHPGAHLGAGEAAGCQRVIKALDEVHLRTPRVKVKILIENTAGMGTSLGHRFDHLRTILRGVRQSRRLGVCIDTCHMFAAGYPLTPLVKYQATMSELLRLVGANRIKAFHVNDSVKPFASRVDRHAHLGKGEIGAKAFQFLVNDARFAKTPMVLETPKENQMDVVNLGLLRKWCKNRRET